MRSVDSLLVAALSVADGLKTPTLTLPGTNDKMPSVGYGTWLSAEGEVLEGTKAALALGCAHGTLPKPLAFPDRSASDVSSARWPAQIGTSTRRGCT